VQPGVSAKARRLRGYLSYLMDRSTVKVGHSNFAAVEGTITIMTVENFSASHIIASESDVLAFVLKIVLSRPGCCVSCGDFMENRS
jgi:hypothetical protein